MFKIRKNRHGKEQFQSIARALRHRNFRLFFSGQIISLTGTWMQRVAMGWLVYQLTHSAFMLGIVGFASQFPVFILTPFAGVLADRRNRHRMIILTQSLALAQALALSILVLTGTVRIWHVIALSIFLGIINSFDMPIRQSFMVEMIEDKKDLGNAIALNSSVVNVARLIGPSIAGLLIAAVGEGICFLLNAISYGAVIASLLMMRISPRQENGGVKKIWQEMADGFRYASGFEPIRAILLLLALMSVMGMPYLVLMPVFARDVLHGGPGALGFLMGFAGLGALAGALFLAARKTVLGLGRIISVSAGIMGLALMGFAVSRNLYVSLALMVPAGFGQIVQMAASNTLLQTIVDDDKRGRVMSFYIMAFIGMAPLGSLLAGAVAGRISAPWAVFIGGVACVAGAVLFSRKLPKLREKVRPIYIRMGIIPEIARGIQAATENSLPAAHIDKD